MKPVFITALLCLSILHITSGQPPSIKKKQLQAIRIEDPIKIDGELNEDIWQKAEVASGFIQNSPSPGKSSQYKSEVRVIYDNTAIYIGAHLFDTQPDSIFKELSERDNIGNSDWFAVILDPYRDGTNGTGFAVTPRGVQLDTKYSANLGGRHNRGGILFSGERSWDSVWDSDIRITENGWVVEIKIPFSALRFPKVNDQLWNINFVRQVSRTRELSYWNEVNPDISGYLNQSGEISGISNIESPIRLSATPFIALYGENYYNNSRNPKSSWSRSFNGGMDIKYGINDAFTLDMTLIPDFGQVRSDNEVLNLSPFEVRFDENRQFFTEGTELFNKGGLFYSRRVGGRPLHRSSVRGELNNNEVIINNPVESQLLNATKISGRTSSGLGIGLFNAIASNTFASIEDIETGRTREIETSPFINYNIVALDQNLKNNSFLSFINTNVLRFGDDYEANVTGTTYSFKNSQQSFVVGGKAVVSQKYYSDRTDLGHSFSTGIGRTSGKIQWGASYSQESPGYDINDLGFMRSPNERAVSGNLSYKKNQPFGRFNEAHVSMNAGYQRLYAPDGYTGFDLNLEGRALTKEALAFGVNLRTSPFEEYDYYEPRTADFSRYYLTPVNYMLGGWFSTDFRKRFSFDMFTNLRLFNEKGRINYNGNTSARYRANDRLSFSFNVRSSNGINNVGYVTKKANSEIIFGVRDNITVENILTTKYVFSNQMSFSFRLRHYWSKAEYHSFALLNNQGGLAATNYQGFHDNSFNAFTIDASYRWRFAPGSDVFIVWKNNTSVFNSTIEDIQYSYIDGIRLLADIPQRNSLSLKVIYYLDYYSLKNR